MITAIFWIYAVIGMSLIFFSNKISSYLYNVILIYTDKTNLNELFLFKTDKTNIDLLFKLAKTFVIAFGVMVLYLSLHYIFLK